MELSRVFTAPSCCRKSNLTMCDSGKGSLAVRAGQVPRNPGDAVM